MFWIVFAFIAGVMVSGGATSGLLYLAEIVRNIRVACECFRLAKKDQLHAQQLQWHRLHNDVEA